MIRGVIGFATRSLAAFMMLQAGTRAFAAEEFLTPPVTVARVEWRAVLDQFRADIGAVPAVASGFTFST